MEKVADSLYGPLLNHGTGAFLADIHGVSVQKADALDAFFQAPTFGNPHRNSRNPFPDKSTLLEDVVFITDWTVSRNDTVYVQGLQNIQRPKPGIGVSAMKPGLTFTKYRVSHEDHLFIGNIHRNLPPGVSRSMKQFKNLIPYPEGQAMATKDGGGL